MEYEIRVLLPKELQSESILGKKISNTLSQSEVSTQVQVVTFIQNSGW